MAADGLEQVLAGAHVSAEVTAPRPDHRALLPTVDGLVPGPGDARSEALLVLAEDEVRTASAGPVEELPRVAAWWEAYRAFGAKPQRTRNSLEALLRRAPGGLPRVDRLTDVYNAVSVDLVRQHDPALFVLDALELLDDDALTAAADDLAGHLARLGPDVRVARRLPPEGAR